MFNNINMTRYVRKNTQDSDRVLPTILFAVFGSNVRLIQDQSSDLVTEQILVVTNHKVEGIVLS